MLRWAYRTFFGGPAVNVLQPPVPRVYLRLRFRDPAGTVRDFPPNYPVRVRFGQGATVQNVVPSPPVQAGGRFSFNARTTDPWQYFTLEFPAANNPYIVCERLGSPPASPPTFALAPGLAGVTRNNERFFSLPQQWELRQADWSPPPAFTGNGRFDAATGRIYHTISPPNDISIGTPAAPVVLTLEPHWLFSRFEYFDRYYGNAHLNSPPGAAHQKRISIPQIGIEGFRNNVNATGSPPDTHSNWAVDLGAGSLLQSLPFILRRDAAGAVLSPPMDGAHLGLRFSQPRNSVVYSKTDVDRVIAVSPPPAAPGPDRLRYYDLPMLWKSRKYYTRRTVSSPPAAGKFFNTLTAAEITNAERQNSPLVFSLDDIVLCVGNSATGQLSGVLSPPADAASSPPSGRVAIFNHRFDSRVGIRSNPQGVYKLLSPPGPDALDLPRSDVAPQQNYLFDYPDWTRMITSRGNVFDVFDQRTADGMSPPNVVGARAAVRWVDATAPLGVAMTTWNPSPPSWTANPDGLPLPGRRLGSVPARVDVPSASPTFSLQPFYQQFTARRYQAAFNVAQSEQIGRYDALLLRCCGVEDGKEVAVSMRYLRSNFNFAGPLSPPLAVSQPVYAQGISQNVANRWSGNDPAVNNYRANFTPQASPPGPLRVDAVWFPQSVALNQAHFAVDLWNDRRDNRGSQSGTGKSGPRSYQSDGPPDYGYAAAHETGHMGALPDEYNERWDAASYQQISFKQNLPGDPYEPDGRTEAGRTAGSAMMNGNMRVRNRFFWNEAEWVRQIVGTPLKVNYKDIGGTMYDGFRLPPHGTAGQTHYPWPLRGLRDQAVSPPAPSPPVPPVAYPTNWGRYDLFLYALGRDHYSANMINAHATPAAPFDAILVVALKITCSVFPSVSPPTRADEISWRETVLSHLAAGTRTIFNHRWGFSGNFAAPAWAINKGLIHIVPQFVVENYPTAADGTVPDATRSALATTVRNTFGVNFQLQVDTSPPAANWSPPGRRLMMQIQNWAQLDALFATEIPRMLGINKAPGALTAADLQPIVRIVLPGAIVRPLP